jgi:hypothetical protein
VGSTEHATRPFLARLDSSNEVSANYLALRLLYDISELGKEQKTEGNNLHQSSDATTSRL